MKNIFITIIFVLLSIYSFGQFNISLGYGFDSDPWNPDGVAGNVGYLNKFEDSKFSIKSHIAYKYMTKSDEFLDADFENQTANWDVILGYNAIDNEKYGMHIYIGPSLRYTKLSGEVFNDFTSIRSESANHIFFLGPNQRTNEIDFIRFGFSFQVENRLEIGSQTFSVSPFIESDISAFPRTGGVYISYYFR